MLLAVVVVCYPKTNAAPLPCIFWLSAVVNGCGGLCRYKEMVVISVMDNVLYNAQRQGRVSFYMTSSGEEATHVGQTPAGLPRIT